MLQCILTADTPLLGRPGILGGCIVWQP